MTEQLAWLGTVAIAAAVSYAPIFLFNAFRVPALQARATSTEIRRLKLAAGEERDAPYFECGLDGPRIDERAIDQYYKLSRYDFGSHTQVICRLWVKNATPRPISDCRIAVEEFDPEAHVRSGDTLVRHFDLSGTETKYFPFLELSSFSAEGSPKRLRLFIQSEEDGASVVALFHRKPLEYGVPYFLTLAVHGRDAKTARLSMVIEAVSEKEVRVAPIRASSVT